MATLAQSNSRWSLPFGMNLLLNLVLICIAPYFVVFIFTTCSCSSFI